ncbi:hypothetical protein KBD49_07130 [Myxococcota bacterium]|nr:hypothetical protein [Myxococcota bacterium]
MSEREVPDIRVGVLRPVPLRSGQVSIGADRWPLAVRLGRRPLAAHLDREPPLVSGIRSLVEGFFPTGDPGFWEFASGAPEGEVLHLQLPPEDEFPEVAADGAPRTRKDSPGTATGSRTPGRKRDAGRTGRTGRLGKTGSPAGSRRPGGPGTGPAISPGRPTVEAEGPAPRPGTTRGLPAGGPVPVRRSPSGAARPSRLERSLGTLPSRELGGLLQALRLRSGGASTISALRTVAAGRLEALRLRSGGNTLAGPGQSPDTPWGPGTPGTPAEIGYRTRSPSLLSSVDLVTLIRIAATPAARPDDAEERGSLAVPGPREARVVAIRPGREVTAAAGHGPPDGAAGRPAGVAKGPRSTGQAVTAPPSGWSMALPAGADPSLAGWSRNLPIFHGTRIRGPAGDGESRLDALGPSLRALRRELPIEPVPGVFLPASAAAPEWIRLAASRTEAAGAASPGFHRAPETAPGSRPAGLFQAVVSRGPGEARRAAREPEPIPGDRPAFSPAFSRTPLSGSGILSPGPVARTSVALGGPAWDPKPAVPGLSSRSRPIPPALVPAGSSGIPGIPRAGGSAPATWNAGEMSGPPSAAGPDFPGFPQFPFRREETGTDPWIDRMFLPLVPQPIRRQPGESREAPPAERLPGSRFLRPATERGTAFHGVSAAKTGGAGPGRPGEGSRTAEERQAALAGRGTDESPERRLGASLAALTGDGSGWLVAVNPSDVGDQRPEASRSLAEATTEPVWIALPERGKPSGSLPRKGPETIRNAPGTAGTGTHPRASRQGAVSSRPSLGLSRALPGSPDQTVLPVLDRIVRRSTGRRPVPGLLRVLRTRLAEASRGLLENRSAGIASRRSSPHDRVLAALRPAAAAGGTAEARGIWSPSSSGPRRLPGGISIAFPEGLRFEPIVLETAPGRPGTRDAPATPGRPWNEAPEETAGMGMVLFRLHRIGADPERWLPSQESATMRPAAPGTPGNATGPGLGEMAPDGLIRIGQDRPRPGSLAGTEAEALAPLARTLFRSLRAMPPAPRSVAMPEEGGDPAGDLVAWIAAGGASQSDGSGRTPVLPGRDPASRAGRQPAGTGTARSAAKSPFFGELPALIANTSGDRDGMPDPVRPEPGRVRLPGLPGEPEETISTPLVEVSLGTASPHSGIGGPGSPGLSPGIPGQPPDLPGPKYHGALPLISAGISTVSAAALASRDRPGEGRSAGSRDPAAQKAREETARGQASLDLEGLAAEMTQRILRRLKREKERRGFHA